LRSQESCERFAGASSSAAAPRFRNQNFTNIVDEAHEDLPVEVRRAIVRFEMDRVGEPEMDRVERRQAERRRQRGK